jgi:HSP20 family protein
MVHKLIACGLNIVTVALFLTKCTIISLKNVKMTLSPRYLAVLGGKKRLFGTEKSMAQTLSKNQCPNIRKIKKPKSLITMKTASLYRPVANTAFAPLYVSDVFDQFFGRNFQTTVDASAKNPLINIASDEQAYYIEVAAPGLEKADFKIEIQHKKLIISSDKKTEQPEAATEKKYSRHEFNFHSVSRSCTLPEHVEIEQISAGDEPGVLFVRIPKKVQNTDQTRTIVIA